MIIVTMHFHLILFLSGTVLVFCITSVSSYVESHNSPAMLTCVSAAYGMLLIAPFDPRTVQSVVSRYTD
jgi:hypothetical protein